jgi:hypothetical protein
MTKRAGSGSESNSQRHGSSDPNPHQNVMDPQNTARWFDYPYMLCIYDRSRLALVQCMADPEAALLEGILGPLAALQRAGRLPSSTPALILLDGLCEAELHRPDYGDTIAGFLGRHLDSFPTWLKVVCTIRTASKQAVRSLPFHTIRYGTQILAFPLSGTVPESLPFHPIRYGTRITSTLSGYGKPEAGFFVVELSVLLRIRIRRIHVFLGLPDPDPLVRDTNPDPFIIKQKY